MKFETGVYTQTLISATLKCAEGKQTMALAGSSNPGVPPVVSLPSGPCLGLKLGFFYLCSSCSLTCRAFSLIPQSRESTPGSLRDIPAQLPSAACCAEGGVPAITVSLSSLLFFVLFF